MSQFKVSEDFKLYQMQSANAFQEAGKAEHGVSMGTTLPVGTEGRAKIVGGSAGKTKAKVVNGQPVPGKPFIILEFEILEPASHIGQKSSRYFDISHHEQYSMTQKLSDWYDWLEDAGMPREIRALGDPNQVFTWASAEVRVFNFIVESGYQGRRDIKSTPGAGALPGATATSSLMNSIPPTVPSPVPPVPTPAPVPVAPEAPPVAPPAAPAPTPDAAAFSNAPAPVPQPEATTSHTPGSTVTAYGQPFILNSLEPNGTCTLKSPTTGQLMPNVPQSALS